MDKSFNDRLSNVVSIPGDNERNSSIELLRLICIYGIICMHCYGDFGATMSRANQIYGVVISSIFNMGVTLFMLISGYFGIRLSLKKLLRLEIAILTCSVFSYLLCNWKSISSPNIFFYGRGAIKAFFPVLTGKYWYISAYIVIFLLSPYLNRIPEILNKKQFLCVICILSAFYVIAPTFLLAELTNDSGKGIANMLLVYFVGMYIKKYGKTHYSIKGVIVWWTLTVFLGVCLNLVLTLLFKKEVSPQS